MQPVVVGKDKVIRFKENAIVRWMLEMGRLGQRFDLNVIGATPFPQEDREQLAQLIGYSVSGYGDLSYVTALSTNTDAEAEKLVKKRSKKQ